MMQNSETASDISPYDLIGIIFGEEHAGRVRGLPHGACPTLGFKKSTTRLSGMNFASSSGTSPNTNDKFVRIENELETMKIQMQALLAYIASKEDVLEYLASIAASLPRPSVNEV